MKSVLARRLTLALAVLLLGFAVVVTAVGWRMSAEHEDEVLQRLSHGLARHIVDHWPEVAKNSTDPEDVAARDALLNMLMVVNPAIEVYILDAHGSVKAFVGDWARVRSAQVDLAPVRAFLEGARLPIRGTDPKFPEGAAKIFSAAMFPSPPGSADSPGYLYVVLAGEARSAVSGHVALKRVWVVAALIGGVGLIATWLVGVWMFQRLSRPLQRLTERIQAYALKTPHEPNAVSAPAHPRDEVDAIGASFDRMVARIEAQQQLQERTQNAHREMIADVAHDLRTPLTVLHGHLEALASDQNLTEKSRKHHVATALAQSDSVRCLSQQLFELATLESADYALQRERFRLDELVSDAVRKFDVAQAPPPVVLSGDAPGPVYVEGDLHLVERALTNLIDNALRHAPDARPVEVGLRCSQQTARILVRDHGQGLPVELAQRLNSSRSVRGVRASGSRTGVGGFGLAIAQRVALLHGGSLTAMTSAGSGHCLCLALQTAPPAEAATSAEAGETPTRIAAAH